MYQDLSTRHDWPVKKAIVDLPIRIKEIRNALWVIRWVRLAPEQGYWRCFADVTYQGWITSATQANKYVEDEFGNLIGAAIWSLRPVIESNLRLTLSLPECLMEFCKVTLTFEFVDEILWCDHSSESSLPVLTHGAICFSKFHKMKCGNLVEICFRLNLAVKGLSNSSKQFANTTGRMLSWQQVSSKITPRRVSERFGNRSIRLSVNLLTVI